MEKELMCGLCKMVFHSTGLLEKHKARFCVGNDVQHLWVRRRSSEIVIRDRPGSEDPKQMKTPDLVQFHKLRKSVEETLLNWSKRSTDSKLGHRERLMEMRGMAERHEHQLASIHAHTQQLEQQRDELVHQACVLAEQSNPSHLDSVLMELRVLEERKEEALQQLNQQHRTLQALQQAYMQSGGSDPVIVAQMTDLQVEAQNLERNQPAAAAAAAAAAAEARTEKKVTPPLSGRLLDLERENQRLEEELLMIQLNRRKHLNYEGRRAADFLDSLGPAPYDPAAGFLVFYDLLLGVDAPQKVVRLVAALYCDGNEAGLPTLLPPVQCLPGASLHFTHSRDPGNYALLSVIQPLPRIQPSPSLSLVVEVQAAHEVFKLSPCGWTQLDLFDQYNQLRSGHWRVPVRQLPFRPSSGLTQLNSIPQVGNMELCVRLANSRDGDGHTFAKPDPGNLHHYKYPAVIPPVPVVVHRKRDQLSSLNSQRSVTAEDSDSQEL
ncbi:coiled-coil domain-containing protein 17 [Aulostomus maculatus]